MCILAAKHNESSKDMKIIFIFVSKPDVLAYDLGGLVLWGDDFIISIFVFFFSLCFF
jgi:hypothetical protein